MQRQAHSETNGHDHGHVRFLNAQQGEELFDHAARHYMKMSGDDFLSRWRAGEFGDPENPYRPELMQVVVLLPFVE
jgi:hypothetical protein